MWEGQSDDFNVLALWDQDPVCMAELPTNAQWLLSACRLLLESPGLFPHVPQLFRPS